jgi:hypothetical protein
VEDLPDLNVPTEPSNIEDNNDEEVQNDHTLKD